MIKCLSDLIEIRNEKDQLYKDISNPYTTYHTQHSNSLMSLSVNSM